MTVIKNLFYTALMYILDFRVQITSVISLAVFILYIMMGTQPVSVTDGNSPLGKCGWVIIIGGLLLRSWAAGILHKERTLATNGPYSLTRHPLYMGTFLSALGFAVLLNEIGFYAMVLALFFLVYLPKMRQEERKMAARFGEQWDGFKQTTFMIFPRRFPPPILAPWQPSQWWLNKEYRAILPAAILLALMEWLSRHPL